MLSEEEKKAIEILKEFKETGYLTLQYKYNKNRLDARIMIENTIETILNLIEKQQAEIEEYKRTLDIFNEREYRKKYLEERRKEENQLFSPDADEVYKRYYEQRVEIEKKNKEINILKDELGYTRKLVEGENK